MNRPSQPSHVGRCLMPQSTPERRKRWGVSTRKAEAFLMKHGFVLTREWHWIVPPGHKITEKERDAVIFLIEEWDFGGILKWDAADG